MKRGLGVGIIVLLGASVARADQEVGYRQYADYFSEKVIPTATVSRVTLKKIADVTHHCVLDFVENVTRSIYRSPASRLVFEEGNGHFSLSQNGPSYGAFLFSGAAQFQVGENKKRLLISLSQPSVLRKEVVVNRETGQRADFFWNGPFGLTISEVDPQTSRSLRFYHFGMDSLSRYLQDDDEDPAMTWGYNLGLPILHATLVKGDGFPDGSELGMEPEKEFRELQLFYPFYFRQQSEKDFEALQIDGYPTEISFSRSDYAACLRSGIQEP